MGVIIFVPLSLIHSGNSSKNPLKRGLGGPHSQSGHFREDTSLAPVGHQTMIQWSSSIKPNHEAD
jgi:hypothetical protein